MKRHIAVLTLMVVCGLYALPSYALPTSMLKTCNVCKGRGWVETWYGREPCEACDGDGKVFSWYNAIGIIGMGLLFMSQWHDKKR